ncbi:MAG: hypothetical protein ACK4UN_00025 [Limisphaerales bacterium]
MNPTLLGSCLFLSICVSYAQTPRVQQLEQFQRRQEITAPPMSLAPGQAVPELYPGESEDIGPQRILQLKPRRTYFEALVDSQFYWSDNVTLAGDNEQDSTIFVNTIQAAFAPRGLTSRDRDIQPRIGVRGQWYNYGLTGGNDRFLGSLDFHAQTLFAEVRYSLAQNLQLYVGTDLSRLVSQSDYDDPFYREVAPYLGFQWLKPIGENKAIGINYRGTYHFSETRSFFFPENVNDRTDHSVSLAYTHELMPRLVLQPYYRFQYTYYTEFNERHDYLHDLGLSLAYHFTNWANLRTFASYQIKDAGRGSVRFANLPDYEKLDVGVGATLVFRF